MSFRQRMAVLACIVLLMLLFSALMLRGAARPAAEDAEPERLVRLAPPPYKSTTGPEQLTGEGERQKSIAKPAKERTEPLVHPAALVPGRMDALSEGLSDGRAAPAPAVELDKSASGRGVQPIGAASPPIGPDSEDARVGEGGDPFEPGKKERVAAASLPERARAAAPPPAALPGGAEAGATGDAIETAAAARTAPAAPEAHRLFAGRFTIEPGLHYTRLDRAHMHLNSVVILDSIFLGQIDIDEVQSDIVNLELTARLGLGERLQLDLTAPLLYRRSVYRSGGADAAGNKKSEATVTEPWQLGDASLGLHWHLVREGVRSPDLVWSARLKAPTGRSPYGIKVVQPDPDNSNLNVPERLPSGSGVWSASTGISLLRSADPAVLFASLHYTHNFEEQVDDISSTEGVVRPARVRLGNAIEFRAGTAFALNERLGLSYAYTQRLTERSAIRPEGDRWTTLTGSDSNAASFELGVTYGMKPGRSLVASLGMGLTDDAPNLQFGMKFPFSM